MLLDLGSGTWDLGQKTLHSFHELYYNSMLKAILQFIFLFCCAFSSVAQLRSPIFSENVSEYGIRISTHDFHSTRDLAQASAFFAAELERCLGSSASKAPLLHLKILAAGDTSEPQPEALIFPADISSLELSYAFCKALVKRRIAEINPGSLQRAELPCVSWLAAAVCNRVFFDGKGLRGRYIPNYEFAKKQFAKGKFPELQMLINMPISADEKVFARIYFLYCDMLTAILENQKDKQEFFRKLIELETFGRSSYESLLFLLNPVLTGNESLQNWFARKLLEESAKSQQINEAENISRQLEELFNIQVLRAGERRAVSRLPLHKIPALLEDYKTNQVALVRIRERLLLLAKSAPALLKESLYEFNEAIKMLQDGQVKAFQKQFKKANKEFTSAVKKQERISRLLDEKEQEQKPLFSSFEQYLQSIEKYQDLQNQLSNLPWN